VKILFNCTNDSCTEDDEYGHDPLGVAAVHGHVVVARVLLEGGANIEWSNKHQLNALHTAAYNGHLDVCRLLLDWGAKVDPVSSWKNTPLHFAASTGPFLVVKLLVERGADVGLKEVGGETASDMARSNGHSDVADWLDSVSRV
jgi:ankyrin repeat protein